MTRILTAALGVTLLVANAIRADDVTLEQNERSIKILAGDEVLGVYNFGEEWKKPFLLPLSAAGGMELLTSGLQEEPADEFAPGNKVYVAQENAELRVFQEVVGHAELGQVIEVAEASDGWLWVPESNGWIRQEDVSPARTTTRRPVSALPCDFILLGVRMAPSGTHSGSVWWDWELDRSPSTERLETNCASTRSIQR